MAQGQDTGQAPGTTADAPPVDDMGDVFDQLTAPKVELTDGPKGAEATPPEGAAGANGGTGAAGGTLPDPTAVAAEGAAGATGAGAPAGGETGATGTGEPPKAPVAAAEPPSEFGKQFLDELRTIIDPKKDAPPAPSPVTPWTAEQQAEVASARAEFPEVFKAVDLELKKLAQTVVSHVFAQLGPRIGQLEGVVTETSNQSHDQQIAAAIPDMATITPKVMEWIGTLPPALKQAYGQVAEHGSVADVVGMVDHWRTASGTAKPAPAAANANGGQQAGAQAPDAAAAAAAAAEAKRRRIAAAAAPVGGKLSGMAVETIDRNDFDGAFDAYSAHKAVA